MSAEAFRRLAADPDSTELSTPQLRAEETGTAVVIKLIYGNVKSPFAGNYWLNKSAGESDDDDGAAAGSAPAAG